MSRRPGYIIGDHWLETAFDRICAGDREEAVLEDYGLVKKGKWIPVSDRLPCLVRRRVVRYVTVELHSDPVLTFGDGEQCVATYGDADGWLSVDNVLLDSVTHWMPLPAPPTDDK